MRILWVTRQFPDQQGSGAQLHEWEFLRALAPAHQITLLSSFWGIRREALAGVRELGIDVETVQWPWNRMTRGKPLKVLRLLRGGAPNWMSATMAPQNAALGRAVAASERAHPVDVVCVVQGDLAPIVEVAQAPTALLLFDVFSRQADLVLQDASPSIRTVRRRIERFTARRWEPSWYGRADSVACVSTTDAQVVGEMLGRDVTTLPNPLPDDFFSPPDAERSADAVTFVGSLGWEPNIDAVRWICDEIWPKVIARRPDARLRVVGRFPSPELRRMVEDAGGELLGDVEDIRPVYWNAAVMLAPIRMGSGLRQKILHAMACRAPLVATPSALEGIEASAGRHLLVADDAGGLADAVVEALDDPAAAAARADDALAFARRFSTAAAGAALEAWLAATATKRRGGPASAPESRGPLRASIVVCTRERPELLRRCLAAVGAAAAAVRGTEVIVVEQGTAHAASICADLGLQATILPDEGKGVSRARNLGARHAQGDVVLFTDDDCEVPPDWVPGHLGALADPVVAASFGQVKGLSRWGEQSADATEWPGRHRRGAPPWIIGQSSNMAAIKSDFLAVGGFDERLGPGSARRAAGEDADLIVRMLRRGSTLVSGAGQPVQHIGWRSPEEERTTAVAYEHGAGVWIGKALREEPRVALSFLRSRAGQLRSSVRSAHRSGAHAIRVSAMAGALGRGLLLGLRMRPWTGPSTGRVSSTSPSAR